MSEATTTFDNLVKIFCDAGRYADTAALRFGLRAVIQALVDESPSDAHLQLIMERAGVRGVCNYILGCDDLTLRPLKSVEPDASGYEAKYNRLVSDYEELLRTVDVVKQERAREYEAAKEVKALAVKELTQCTMAVNKIMNTTLNTVRRAGSL